MSTHPEQALLSCPFCGRTDLLGVEPGERGFLHVKCRACGALGPGGRSETDAEAHACWNRRAALTPQAPQPTAQADAMTSLPYGWDIKPLNEKPFKGYLVIAPNGYAASVYSHDRNPSNVLYLLADALAAAQPSGESTQ